MLQVELLGFLSKLQQTPPKRKSLTDIMTKVAAGYFLDIFVMPEAVVVLKLMDLVQGEGVEVVVPAVVDVAAEAAVGEVGVVAVDVEDSVMASIQFRCVKCALAIPLHTSSCACRVYLATSTCVQLAASTPSYLDADYSKPN